MKDLTKEFAYFNSNLDFFKQEYLGKHIVIKNEKVLGVYNNFDEAMEKTCKTEEVGTFLIQKVNKNPEAYTIYYNTITVVS